MKNIRGFSWAIGGCALLLVVGSYLAWHREPSKAVVASGAGKGTAAPVPVTMGTAEKADVPVYLNSLGTVQGFNTVVVRTRVDGQINEIAFKEGQLVKEGDLLVQIDPRPFQANLDQANAKMAQDEATLSNAQLDLQRYTKLGDFAAKQQTDTQRSTVKQLTAQVMADQAAIANAKTQLDYTTVRAPISGITGFRLVDIGNIVNASTQTGIVNIAQIEPISVVFTAPEEQFPEINKAIAKQPLKVTALTSDGRTVLSEGALSIVNNQVDSTSGTIRLKATFENKDHALWPGLSVSTRLLVTTLKGVVTVADDAIQHGPEGLYVYVVGDDNHARAQKVTVHQSTDGRTVVDKGLNAGDRIIVSGQYRVQDGTLVAAAPTAQTTAKAD
jgi:multidrug efflux system membrane fusion protein